MNYESVLRFWQAQKITTKEELHSVIDGKIIALAYHSGKIENDAITYHDTREIFDHDGITAYTGDLRTLFEIKNAKDAFFFLLESFAQRAPLNTDFLCRLQYELTKNTYDEYRWSIGERPGTFKKHDFVTGRAEVGALPEDVGAETAELLEEPAPFSASKNEDILTAGAYFHAKLENIHPFADGNGRTGRLALNYFFLLRNHPPVIIHEEDRRQYFSALEAWDTKQALSKLIKFLQDQLVKTWGKNIAKHKKSLR